MQRILPKLDADDRTHSATAVKRGIIQCCAPFHSLCSVCSSDDLTADPFEMTVANPARCMGVRAKGKARTATQGGGR